MGRRLAFEVEPGLYRGRPQAIGFDGIWTAPDGHQIIVEVKTTDYVTVSLDKTAEYKRRLIDQVRVRSSASILIIVGREDTGALEAQIRGSRFAWEMRLIGADRLDNLVQIKEQSDDDATITQIHDILKPFEYTKVDKIIDVMFSAARDVGPVEESFATEVDDRTTDSVSASSLGARGKSKQVQNRQPSTEYASTRGGQRMR